MRTIAFIIAAAALSACGQAQQSATRGDCNFESAREISWPEGDLQINAVARSTGATCAEAEATLELRAADGRVLHTTSASYYALAFGGDTPAEPPAVAREEVERFLAAWADLRPLRASALPAWPASAAQPGEGGALPYRARAARADYERYRAANLPAVCVAVQVDSVECLVIEPETGAHVMLGYAE